MSMSAILSIFSFRGRISRGGFWWRTVLVWILFMILNGLIPPAIGVMAVWVINPMTLWALAALAIQRLHDRNMSGRWLLLALIPIVGAVCLFWQLALRRGVADSNRWGGDPLASNADFLVVK
jgi:uncharacterized membrane protein YhaH (DUF805 family)